MSLKTFVLAVLATVLGSVGLYVVTGHTFAASFPDPRVANSVVASSTAYSLTWGATATRILASSTLPGTRIAASIDVTNCAAGGVVYLQHNDVVAATSTGKAVFATTTMTYADTIPVVSGSIRAMAAVGNCTLLVTEYRTSL